MKSKICRITTTLLFAACFGVPNVSPAAQKPVEVISDPYGSGNPTKYSILRANNLVTFSHPLNGQFTRVEVSKRTATGTNFTRFLISADQRKYRPILHLEIPFRVMNSAKESTICTDENPISLIENMQPKVKSGEEVAKTRDMLTKGGFFDPSCFDPKIKEPNRNAILNAAAEIFTVSAQGSPPETRLLKCMEHYNYGAEAGIIQALAKQSLSKPAPKPRLTVSCIDDTTAKPAQYIEASNTIAMRATGDARRIPFGARMLHEFFHPVGILDGSELQALEDCCGMGARCAQLKAFGEQKKSGDKRTPILETADPRNVVVTGQITALVGPVAEPQYIGEKSELVKQIQNASVTEENKTEVCQNAGEETCLKSTISLVKQAEDILDVCVPPARLPLFNSKSGKFAFLELFSESAIAAKKNCKSDIGADASPEVKKANADYEQKSYAELAETIPQNSPIQWETPAESVPTRLSQNLGPDASEVIEFRKKSPSRSIASISPLPEPKAQRRLGDERNRGDVSTRRAVLLMNAVESAADKVTQTITQEKMDQLKVDPVEIFNKDFKPRSQNPQYIVASFASKGIQVADIGDIKNLEFQNPFKTNSKNENDSAHTLASAPKSNGKASSKKSEAGNSNTDSSAAAFSNEDSMDKKSNVAKPTQAAIAAASEPSQTRQPSASSSHQFKNMDGIALIGFLTSSFRTVSTELENPELAQALVANEIQVIDHENRRIGSTKPKTTFVYRADVARLVQTRLDRAKK